MVIERSVLVLGALVILLMVRGLLKRHAKASEAALEKTMVEIRPQPPEQLSPGHHVAGALPSGSSAVRQIEEHQRRMLSGLPDLDTQLSDEVVQMKQLQEQLEEFAVSSPENAARLLKTWLIEG